MPRRGKIALGLSDVELEIADRSGGAVEQVPVVECAAAVLQAALPLGLVALDDLHGDSPLCHILHPPRPPSRHRFARASLRIQSLQFALRVQPGYSRPEQTLFSGVHAASECNIRHYGLRPAAARLPG
jgi:hypothetical protein